MSNKNMSMTQLLARQAEERKDFALAAYKAWQSVKEREADLLKPFDGEYDKAFPRIQGEIDEMQKEFTKEWGSEGRLASIQDKQHAKERERLADRQHFVSRLKERIQANRNRQKDQERER